MWETLRALLSDEHGWLITLGSLAVLAGFWGVITHRLLTRRTTTIDLLYRLQTNAETAAYRQRFIHLEKTLGKGGIAKFADADHEDHDDTKVLQYVLNQFELIAIGIEVGILDYQIYKRYNQSFTINFYHRAAPFIHALRARIGNDALYHEFEQLTWWLKGKRMPRRRRFRGIIF